MHKAIILFINIMDSYHVIEHEFIIRLFIQYKKQKRFGMYEKVIFLVSC